MTRRLTPADYRDMPWKNGAGTTRELVRIAHPSDPERFTARLSIATVAASGPFSTFAGVDRTLLLLDGDGMALSFGGEHEVVLDQPLRPLAFPGEAPVSCRLLGSPVRDFNLMVDRIVAEATLEVMWLAPGDPRTIASADIVLLYGLDGEAMADDERLRTSETLWIETARPFVLVSDRQATVVVIRLRRR